MGGKIKITDDELLLIISTLKFRAKKLHEKLHLTPNDVTAIDAYENISYLEAKLRKARKSQL